MHLSVGLLNLCPLDIYTPNVKNQETWVKTDINDRGDEHGGILFERDPARHRRVAKQLAPAFSSRSTRAKEPTLHKHVELFVERMRSIGSAPGGVDVAQWSMWVAMDISADMAYNREMNCLRDSRYS